MRSKRERGTATGSAAFLTILEDVIRRRLEARSPDSYVASLAAGGDRRLAQKVGEEAVELVIAVTAGDRQEQIDEAADLLFHLLVLLNVKGIRLEDILATLERRHKDKGEPVQSVTDAG